MKTSELIHLSIIVPVYAGERYIEDLCREVEKLRKQWIDDDAPITLCELIFVDDEAIDGSPKILDGLSDQYTWVTTLHLSRNFGQHPATIVGILHSSGDLVVTLDEDLQHPPSAIPALIATMMSTECDTVYAKPTEQVHKGITRDFTSRFYKYFMEKLTGEANIRKINSFRLMRGSIARGISSVCGHDVYFDVAVLWFTKRIETHEVAMRDQRYIETKMSGYSFFKIIIACTQNAYVQPGEITSR